MESPIATSIMADSHIGVFLTLSTPNFSAKPSVTLNTPPYSAISCPIRTKLLFFSIDWNKPSEISIEEFANKEIFFENLIGKFGE